MDDEQDEADDETECPICKANGVEHIPADYQEGYDEA